MARIVQDEKKTYPLTWFVIGSLFAGATVFAIYAELVTRVPWQRHQAAFYDMELEQARRGYQSAKTEFDRRSRTAPLAGELAHHAELMRLEQSGPYAEAAKALAELDAAYAEAESDKTFAGSDLDAAYYYRNQAEYQRDAAQVRVRTAFSASYLKSQTQALDGPDQWYADPKPPSRRADQSAADYHLVTESARMGAHAERLGEAARGSHPAALLAALRASRQAELRVVQRLRVERKHQARIDAALTKMAAIDGPPEPELVPGDAAGRERRRLGARTAVCLGQQQTRHCLRWLKLEPVDQELKQLDIAIAKVRRPLEDARLRLKRAREKAKPKLDMGNLLGSLVGPYQIAQIVTAWISVERDVDKQQVDRCQTCHMGVDSKLYTDPAIPPAYRTHPRRNELFSAHPVAKFGCTACHQGQGRATNDLAHSGWQLEVVDGKERWHFAGDHYWEDPLLSVGRLTQIIVDERNDELTLRIGKAKRSKVALDRRVYADEAAFYAALQAKIAEVLARDEKLAGAWRAIVRRVDGRVQIGIEQLRPRASLGRARQPRPRLRLRFEDPLLARLLGFGTTRSLDSKMQPAVGRREDAVLLVAAAPPALPVRSRGRVASGRRIDAADDYQYAPPSGSGGLQVPDSQRNRFIQALPQIESGCLRCHTQDADLVPRRSRAEYVSAKLRYQQAEAERVADPAGYRLRHGSDELPRVPPAPAEARSLAPTLDEGRQLFRQLNCRGCHLLEGFEDKRIAGPGLDNLSAKVSPRWLLTWLRYPRAWRRKTSMPNLWPAPLDPASKLPYPPGSPEHRAWLDLRADETLDVASFLYDRSEHPGELAGHAPTERPLRERIVGYAQVEGADAKLGKQLFEAYGCQGCHATVDGGASLPRAWRDRERDLAPTLSNLAQKTTADWLAYWVEDPRRYWPGALMPKLRLSRLEAAAMAQYLVSLKSPPPAAAPVHDDEIAIVADAKRRHERVRCAVAGGKEVERVECGRKIIEHRGCYGCHQLTGFEKLAPIGPELTGFAKKDITTLDFGYALSDHHLQTNLTFAALKLDAPRIFVRDRIELRMGDFDLSPAEIRALLVFLGGTVPVRPNETFDPNKHESYAAALKGRQLARDYNCRGCHVIEGHGADIDGLRVTKLTQDPQRRAPWLNGEGARVQPEWLFAFLRAPAQNGVRPWLHPEWVWGDEVPADKRALRMPSFDLGREGWTAIVRYFASWDQQPYPYHAETRTPRRTGEKLWALRNMVSTQTGNCLSCHYFGSFPVERGRVGLAAMSPNLDNVRHRLRPGWVRQWLLRPHNYLPYTKMTAFFASVDRPKTAARWPGENDPFLSPPAPGWNAAVPALGTLSTRQQVELLRDFLFSLPDGASWPTAGDEDSSVMVRPAGGGERPGAVSAEVQDERPPAGG